MVEDILFNSIKNKKILITGASGGIGASMAEIFSDYCADVGIHFNSNQKEANIISEKIRKKSKNSKVFKANLLDKNQRISLIDSFVKEFGKIDVLINNAGAIYDYIHFSKLDEKSWDNTFDLNVKAPFYLSSYAFKLMEKNKGGRIINISSANVKYGGGPRSFHYCASKAALETLTVGFAREGAKNNILVNAIRCGVIDTSMHTKIKGYTEENFKKRKELIPLGRTGKPEDIARMALFLASECGNFITGEIFTIAGGE